MQWPENNEQVKRPNMYEGTPTTNQERQQAMSLPVEQIDIRLLCKAVVPHHVTDGQLGSTRTGVVPHHDS
jgi:hypothetical protein